MTTTQAGPAFCTSCGAARRGGAGFCTGCGAAFAAPTLPAPRDVPSGPNAFPSAGPPSWRSGPSSWPSGPQSRPFPPAAPTRQAPPPTWIAPTVAPPLPSERVVLTSRPWYARPATAAAAALVAVLAVAGAVFAVTGSTTPSRTPVVDSANTINPADAIRRPTVPAPAPTGTDPGSQLQSLADSDSPTVEGLVGSWIPQLSSKRPGLVADGQTWDAAAILQESQTLRSSYPDARLLWTGDFANYRGRNFWATVVGEPAPTAAAANAWCDARALDADHCYAVRLTHTGGPDGNAVLRPKGSG